MGSKAKKSALGIFALGKLTEGFVQGRKEQDELNEKIAKRELEALKAKLDAEKDAKEQTVKYGTGAPPPVQPGKLVSKVAGGPEEQMFGFEATMPSLKPETTEEMLNRMGTERFKALPEQKPQTKYAIPQYDANGNVVGFTEMAEGLKPFGGRGPQKPSTAGYGNRILPADTVTQLADFQTLTKQVEGLKGMEIDRFVGLQKPLLGKSRQYAENVSTPEGATFYQTINDIRNQLIYLRSGKQINEQEYKRLAATLPDEYKSPTDFRTKLQNFQTLYDNILNQRLQAYDQAGYNVSGFKRENGGVPSVGGTFNGQKVKSVTRID